MPDEPAAIASPIDLLREAAAGPIPADSPEYGIAPRALPVTNSDTAPMRVKLTSAEAMPDDLAKRVNKLEREVARLKVDIWGVRGRPESDDHD